MAMPRAYSDRFWTLDPVDGTKGFLRGQQYAIALALIIDGQIQVAALACPNLDGGYAIPGSIYTARRNSGTMQLPLFTDGTTRTVCVSNTRDTSLARYCESMESGHTVHGTAARLARHLNMTTSSIRLDSQAKYAVVARGEADIYLRLPAQRGYIEKIWDHASGALILAEAGGRVTDCRGNPLEFTHGTRLHTNRGIIATNGYLHDAVVEGLHTVA